MWESICATWSFHVKSSYTHTPSSLKMLTLPINFPFIERGEWVDGGRFLEMNSSLGFDNYDII